MPTRWWAPGPTPTAPAPRSASLAEAALDRVAATIVKTLRSSDIVARIGDGRIIAALGFANSVAALTVAETLRLAIAGMGTHSPSSPVLTATIGVASYPNDGADAADLISAATEALKLGRSFGPNGVAASSDHDPAHASARRLVGRRES